MTWLGPPCRAGPACCPPPSVSTRSSSGDIPWCTHCAVQSHRGQLEWDNLRGTEVKEAAMGDHKELCSAMSFMSTKGNAFTSILARGVLISHQLIIKCTDSVGWPYKPAQSPTGSTTPCFTLMTLYTRLACTAVHVLPAEMWWESREWPL